MTDTAQKENVMEARKMNKQVLLTGTFPCGVGTASGIRAGIGKSAGRLMQRFYCPLFVGAAYFEASDHVLEIGIPALGILAFAWIVAGSPAPSFCRNAQQAWKCGSAVDGIYSCGIFRDTACNLFLENRVREDTGREA